MKPITHRLLAASRWLPIACCCRAALATVTLNSNDTFTTAPSPNGDLTIAGDLGVLKGIDFGVTTTNPPLAAVQLNYFGGIPNTAMFDLTAPLGSFQWRDNLLATAMTKMKLDSSNTLTLYKYDGTTTGIQLNPNTSRICLPSTGGGIYAGTTPVFTVDATGKLVFGKGPLVLTNTTAATSSTTGALTVAGGLGVAQDAYINGVRVGQGGSTSSNSGNTVLGTGTLQMNSIKGVYNTAVGYDSLCSNFTGKSNTATGFQALMYVTDGSNNVAIGALAGSKESNGYRLNGSQNSIYIGANSSGSSRDNHTIVIGASATSEGSQTTVIGSPMTEKTHLHGSSFALGTFASAVDRNSIAMGDQSHALACHSIALGAYSNCSKDAYESVAMTNGSANKEYTLAASYGSANACLSMAYSTGIADGNSSIAIGGYDNNYANWPGNQSIGDNSTALGGVGNQALGFASYASGFWTKAVSAHSLALGSLNHGLGNQSIDWQETDPLLELGNGTAPRDTFEPDASNRSNAITTLKNGQTTLTNKAWLANVACSPADPAAPLADPPPATDSGGEALVVEGHTRLKGKVIIEQPQGDISMGIYGP